MINTNYQKKRLYSHKADCEFYATDKIDAFMKLSEYFSAKAAEEINMPLTQTNEFQVEGQIEVEEIIIS